MSSTTDLESDVSRSRARPVKWLFDLGVETYHAWRGDRVLRLGAGIAYYALFGIVPLLTIMAWVAGLVFSTDEVQNFVATQLGELFDGDSTELAATLSMQLDNSLTGLGVVGLGSLLFAASVLFIALQDALNVIWHAPVRSGIHNTVRRRLTAFGVVLLTAVVLIADLLINAIVGLAETIVPGNAEIVDSLSGLITTAGSWVLGIIAIALVFRLLPYVEIPWRESVIGATVTALLVVVGSALLGVYFSRFGFGSLTGVAGSLALFLLWIYYEAQILLAGAVLTKVLTTRSERRG